ncbi:MAG TPA: response regulator [Crenalkalicoccus sp.]|jgi:CheY-like chemotaxis protein|nr:response regulator [Crenalkalicoccus sp.]
MDTDPPVLLVVEDDFLVRLTLVDALSDGGFQVLEAPDAEQALAIACQRRDLSAMLTDINLPGAADGFALARAVRVARPGLPIIYASGRYTAMDSGKAVEGARFLAKPFTPTHAVAVIWDMLEAPRAARGETARAEAAGHRL